MITVEICTPSAASALAAKQGGAQRVELCRDLQCGGLTPTDADIEYCVHELGLRTHVLVRPRSGNFCYTDAEVAEVMNTIDRCRQIGAAAVVVGFLTAEGCVDVRLTRMAVERAGQMQVTFHRAFDEARQNPLEALVAIAACGCNRLLTSGQKATAAEGAGVIKSLVEATHDPVFRMGGMTILAGSGITAQNARQIVQQTGVCEVHGSCKATLADGRVETSAQQVQQLLRAVADL